MKEKTSFDEVIENHIKIKLLLQKKDKINGYIKLEDLVGWYYMNIDRSLSAIEFTERK